MKYIVRSIVCFLKAEKYPLFYILFLIFLGICFWFNYDYGAGQLRSFDKSVIESYFGQPEYFWLRLLFYGAPYYFTCLLYSAITKRTDFYRSGNFWFRSIFALVLLCWSCDINKYVFQVNPYLEPQERMYAYKILFNSNRIITILLPLGIYYLLAEKHKSALYGFTAKHFKFRPYLIMLLIMLPLIVWASFQPDFINTQDLSRGSYPTYKPGIIEEYHGLSWWQTVVPYEVIYILDFITIELLFRGFMVISLKPYMGRAAVFPMVATYAFLHFGKPMAEAVGSVAGGFILGVIAFDTGSILGGILIHCGVALFMDLAAYFQIWRQS